MFDSAHKIDGCGEMLNRLYGSWAPVFVSPTRAAYCASRPLVAFASFCGGVQVHPHRPRAECFDDSNQSGSDHLLPPMRLVRLGRLLVRYVPLHTLCCRRRTGHRSPELPFLLCPSRRYGQLQRTLPPVSAFMASLSELKTWAGPWKNLAASGTPLLLTTAPPGARFPCSTISPPSTE